MTIESERVTCDLGHSHWSRDAEGYCDHCEREDGADVVERHYAHWSLTYYEYDESYHFCSAACLCAHIVGHGDCASDNISISLPVGGWRHEGGKG